MQEEQALSCLRCGTPIRRVRIETWSPGNLLLKQLQKIAENAGLQFYHCPKCGKLEFYRIKGK